MLYMVTIVHSPESCPMSNPEVRNKALAGSKKTPELIKSLGVTSQGSWTNLLNHTTYMVVDAPDPHTMTRLLNDAGYLDWNNITVEPVMPTREATEKYSRQT